MISDQSQSGITGTKMTVSYLVSIAGYFFPTQDGLEDPIFSGEVTGHGHSPPASRSSTLLDSLLRDWELS